MLRLVFPAAAAQSMWDMLKINLGASAHDHSTDHVTSRSSLTFPPIGPVMRQFCGLTAVGETFEFPSDFAAGQRRVGGLTLGGGWCAVRKPVSVASTDG